MKKFHFPKNFLTSIFFFVLIFEGCQKENRMQKTEPQPKPTHVASPTSVTQGSSQRVAPTCYPLSPLAWVSSSRLQGSYGAVTLNVDYPYWPISCSDGTPIQLQNYLPFYGQLSIEGSNGTVNMQPGISNQFVISIGTWSLPDGQAVEDGINNFQQAWNTWVSSGSGPAPDVSTYVPASTSSTITLTGKLVRTTTGSTFAAIGTCYPNVFPCMTGVQ